MCAQAGGRIRLNAGGACVHARTCEGSESHTLGASESHRLGVTKSHRLGVTKAHKLGVTTSLLRALL